jgi:hypothetical protein
MNLKLKPCYPSIPNSYLRYDVTGALVHIKISGGVIISVLNKLQLQFMIVKHEAALCRCGISDRTNRTQWEYNIEYCKHECTWALGAPMRHIDSKAAPAPTYCLADTRS